MMVRDLTITTIQQQGRISTDSRSCCNDMNRFEQTNHNLFVYVSDCLEACCLNHQGGQPHLQALVCSTAYDDTNDSSPANMAFLCISSWSTPFPGGPDSSCQLTFGHCHCSTQRERCFASLLLSYWWVCWCMHGIMAMTLMYNIARPGMQLHLQSQHGATSSFKHRVYVTHGLLSSNSSSSSMVYVTAGHDCWAHCLQSSEPSISKP